MRQLPLKWKRRQMQNLLQMLKENQQLKRRENHQLKRRENHQLKQRENHQLKQREKRQLRLKLKSLPQRNKFANIFNAPFEGHFCYAGYLCDTREDETAKFAYICQPPKESLWDNF